MISKSNVQKVCFLRGLRHVDHGIRAVAEIAMAMKIAADIVDLNEFREFPFHRRLNFATVFAQLRLNVRKSHCSVHILLRARREETTLALRCSPKDAVFGDRESITDSEFPDMDIVILTPREVMEGCPKNFRINDTNIGI